MQTQNFFHRGRSVVRIHVEAYERYAYMDRNRSA